MERKFSFILVIMIFLLEGCDVVDQVPTSELTGRNFWLSPGDAEAGLVAVYDQLQSLGSDRLMFLGDGRADNMEVPADLGWHVAIASMIDFKKNLFDPSHGQASWAAFYTGIARANDVIAHIPDIAFTNEAERNRIMGEALFLRAYFHFVLVKNWGDVPLILAPYTKVSDDMKVHRAPEVEVYAQLIADITAAEELLPIQHGNDLKTRIRATKGAAQALLCNVYLERGYKSYGTDNDFTNAAEYAERVMGNSLYSLLPGESYASIFKDGATRESILEIYYDYTIGEKNTLTQNLLPRAYSKSRPYGGDFNMVPSLKITDQFEPGDLRTPANFQRVPDPTPYYDSEFEGAPYIAKYLGTVVTEGVLREGDSNFILYRLSDIMLMRAEALQKLGDLDEAEALLNEIRNRAGLGDVDATGSDALFRAIQKERFYELCFEGKRWYDLVRTGLLLEEIPSHNARVLLPVSQTEIERNPNLLPQNPGY